MSTRLPVLLRACAAALLTPAPGVAASIGHECAGPTIQADADFRQHYPELLERLRSALPPPAHVDPCAVVDLQLASAAITVSVSLPDGRTATRNVARREDVLPTLQALLLVPQGAAPAVAEPAPVTAKAAAPVAAPASAPTRPAVAAAEPNNAVDDVSSTLVPRRHGFELSLISGVRVGDGQWGYGAGVLSFIELQRWLLGFQGRVDGYRAWRGSDPETALSLGLLLGRRFELGDTALDVTAGPAVAMRGASFSSTEQVSVQSMSSTSAPQPRGVAAREPDIGPTPRLLLGARLGFTPRSVFRTFIGLDGELGPAHSADAPADAGASGRMPAYSVGLALGATVGTR